MSNIMSHSEWMKRTKGGFTQSRSKALKAIDAALKEFDQAPTEKNKGAILKALISWQQSKGNNWKQSIRNKENAVDNLYRQLTGLGNKADMFALSHIQNESRAIITDLFQGKKLIFRPGLLTKIAGNSKTLGINTNKVSFVKTTVGIGRDGHTLSSSSSSSSNSGNSAKAAKLSKDLLNEIIPKEFLADVMAAISNIMPNFLTELAASCMPFVGVIFSGGSAVVAGCKAAQAVYKLDRAQMHAQRTLSTAEPAAAFEAITRMLKREAEQKTEKFAKGLADFGSKLASTLADGGTATNAAIGLASGLIKLLMLLRIVLRDIQERNAANELLSKPIITIKLFGSESINGSVFYLLCAHQCYSQCHA